MIASRRQLLLSAVVTAIAIVGLSACGGGGSNSSSAQQGGDAGGEVVAQVAGTSITRTQVGHWMTTLAGIDYYTASGHAALPGGVVSDPPDYGRCVARIEAIGGAAKQAGVQLLSKCRQLDQALRIQATSYLVGAQRAIALAEALGIRPTEGEVRRQLERVNDRTHPTQAAYRKYLATTGAIPSDGLLEAKLELLGSETLAKLSAPGQRGRYLSSERRLASTVSCQPGYVVEYCRQYKGGATYPSTPSPSVLMEQLAVLIGSRQAHK